jgi:ParB/RepB/Spo0J family partition protein
MAATLTMVPLAKIKPRAGFNPRAEFGDVQMAELVASVRQHGIITPLTLAPDGDGFVIVAGERRYRAAKQARLKEVPAQVRDADGDALTLAVAENVIRADLNPVEEARAYERLVADHGDAAQVAKLVGRSEKLIGERLQLLCLPAEAQALLAARRVPLACAPPLIRIAEREPLLADLCAVWLADRHEGAARFPADPGEVVDDVLEAEWRGEDGQPLHPVAYSVGGWHGPILPGGRSRDELLPRIRSKLGEHGEPIAAAYAELPAIPQEDEYDWQARQAVEQRERECFALTDEDADAARAFGCLLDLSGADGREHLYVTDPEWLADRLCQKIAAHATAEAERRQREREARTPSASGDDAEKEARRQQRQRDYEARVVGRARNLDLGAALARWQPKLAASRWLGRSI